MRNNNIKERLPDKSEFVYMYRETFKKLDKLHINHPDIRVFVRQYVRPVIPYSCKTNDVDIYISLHKLFNQIIKSI